MEDEFGVLSRACVSAFSSGDSLSQLRLALEKRRDRAGWVSRPKFARALEKGEWLQRRDASKLARASCGDDAEDAQCRSSEVLDALEELCHCTQLSSEEASHFTQAHERVAKALAKKRMDSEGLLELLERCDAKRSGLLKPNDWRRALEEKLALSFPKPEERAVLKFFKANSKHGFISSSSSSRPLRYAVQRRNASERVGTWKREGSRVSRSPRFGYDLQKGLRIPLARDTALHRIFGLFKARHRNLHPSLLQKPTAPNRYFRWGQAFARWAAHDAREGKTRQRVRPIFYVRKDIHFWFWKRALVLTERFGLWTFEFSQWSLKKSRFSLSALERALSQNHSGDETRIYRSYNRAGKKSRRRARAREGFALPQRP